MEDKKVTMIGTVRFDAYVSEWDDINLVAQRMQDALREWANEMYECPKVDITFEIE